MSRWITFVLAATSALALATTASPVAAPASAPDVPTVTAGMTTGRVGGSWCC